MSVYSDIGRIKLANWVINCVYIDLVICGIILFFNFTDLYDYLRLQPLSTALILGLILIYAAIIAILREKVLQYGDDIWRQLSEVTASFYFLIHCILYFLILGLFLSGIYLSLTRVQISSDFLSSWAIIFGVMILIGFYLRNKDYRSSSGPDSERIHTDPRWDYPYGHMPTKNYDRHENEWEIPVKQDLNCFICGKRDILPLKGKDGRYYCRDHILPENRVIDQNSVRSTTDSAHKPDTRCKNPRCKREIYHTEIIQCGPCGNFFCKYCWEGHRWSHGKAPAVGISYTSKGTFSGYDGSENIRRDR